MLFYNYNFKGGDKRVKGGGRELTTLGSGNSFKLKLTFSAVDLT